MAAKCPHCGCPPPFISTVPIAPSSEPVPTTDPAQVEESNLTQIYITRGEDSSGPFTLEEVQDYLEEGILLPDDLAWCEGQDSWVALDQFDLDQRVTPPASKPLINPDWTINYEAERLKPCRLCGKGFADEYGNAATTIEKCPSCGCDYPLVTDDKAREQLTGTNPEALPGQLVGFGCLIIIVIILAVSCPSIISNEDDTLESDQERLKKLRDRGEEIMDGL